MIKIQKLNEISSEGLKLFPQDKYEVASEFNNPHGIILRSFKMHNMELADSVKAIARAGAGVNNIPVDKCSEKGIVVFNTPGANANAVKELVVAGMLLSARDIIGGNAWVKTIADKGDEVPKLVEKNKKQFAGNEIKGKKLGVIGLGAIGALVANSAHSLGMEVVGYDPFISVDAAWSLSKSIQRENALENLLAESDYISLHVPLNDKTRGYINAEKLNQMKKGVKILNFSRGGLVDNAALKEAVDQGKVGSYVTDFPDADVIGTENVIPLPHLGASTTESEENCAVMAVQQLRDYIENGNIKNSVNFPDCDMGVSETNRIVIANRNIPNMVSQITKVFADEKENISDMINKHKGKYAYNIIDVDEDISESLVKNLEQIEGVLMVRVLEK